MILYFSGTGNSTYAARRMAEAIEYGKKSLGKPCYRFEAL